MEESKTTKSLDAVRPLGASGSDWNAQHGNAPSPGDTFYYRYGFHILQTGMFVTEDEFKRLKIGMAS